MTLFYILCGVVGFVLGIKYGLVNALWAGLGLLVAIGAWVLFSWFCDWLDGVSN
jgi:hypothetical protein